MSRSQIAQFLDHAKPSNRPVHTREEEAHRAAERAEAGDHPPSSHARPRRNVNLKDSGIPALGKIPSHWDAARFKSQVGFERDLEFMAADFRGAGRSPSADLLPGSARRDLAGCNFLDPSRVREKWRISGFKWGTIF